MSIRVMTRVWDHSHGRWGDLLLLLAIADSAHDDGVAYPSVDILARKSRMSRRGVQTAVARLVDAGELAVEKRPGRYGTNAYRVLVGLVPAPAAEGRTDCAPEGRILRPPGAQITTPRGAQSAPLRGAQPAPNRSVKTVTAKTTRTVKAGTVKTQTADGIARRRSGCSGDGHGNGHEGGDGNGDGPTEAETRAAIARVRQQFADGNGHGADVLALNASGLPVRVAVELAKGRPSRVRPALHHALAYAERELARGHQVNLPGVIRTAIEKGWRTGKRRPGPAAAAATPGDGAST